MYICQAFGVSYCKYCAFGHLPLFGNSSALSEAEIARIQIGSAGLLAWK